MGVQKTSKVPPRQCPSADHAKLLRADLAITRRSSLRRPAASSSLSKISPPPSKCLILHVLLALSSHQAVTPHSFRPPKILVKYLVSMQKLQKICGRSPPFQLWRRNLGVPRLVDAQFTCTPPLSTSYYINI